MSFFNPKIPLKTTAQSHHPWENRIKAKYSNTYKHVHNSVTNPTYPAPKTSKILERPVEHNKNERITFTVLGNRVTKEFIYCLYLVKGLHKCKQRWFEAPVIRGLTGVEWPKVWNDLKLKFGSLVYCLKAQVAVLKNDEFLGGENELKDFVENRYVYNVYLDYYKEGIQQFANFIKSSGRPCVYMHVSIDNKPAGCLIFMLYSDIAPLTCQNFMKMCHSTRGGYSGSPVHRIVQDCWIQCGGFLLRNPNEIICENFIVPHDRRGVIGMVNDGRHRDCSTQFFVLLQPAPWMDNKYVAFGQLIEGERTLCKIESVTTWYDSPTSNVIIDKAGILNLHCQRIPINKSVIAYTEAHIEDLVALGTLFYEALLDKVFEQIDFKTLQKLEMEWLDDTELDFREGETEKPIRKTERFNHKKEGQHDNLQNANSDGIAENNDFDVDEYEYEDIYDEMPIIPVPSSVVVPTDLYYLPLTDVPYPEDVDSIYDLQKFLRGDYCLESDLQTDLTNSAVPKDAGVPKAVIDTLFDYLTIDVDLSDSSLDEEDENLVKIYLLENNDKVSFAGRIVSKMANFTNKMKLFDGTINEKTNRDILSDEDLRLMRNVSLSILETQLPHGLIRRRQTGYVRPEDVAYLLGDTLDEDDTDDSEDGNMPRTDSARFVIPGSNKKTDLNRAHLLYPDDSGSLYSRSSQKIKEEIRKVKIASSANLLRIPNRGQNQYANMYLEDDDNEVRRTSLLQRLYDEFDSKGDDHVAPTLKNYKPWTETHVKTFMLTNSHFTNDHVDEREKYLHNINRGEDYSIDRILQLQHGKKAFRKISSDYVRTIDQFEHLPSNSIRSIEYSKKRPAMTVAEYQKINRDHEEQLQTTQDKITVTDSQNSKRKKCTSITI